MKSNSSLRSIFTGKDRGGAPASRSQDNADSRGTPAALVESKTTVLKRRVANARAAAAGAAARVSGRESSVSNRDSVQYSALQQQVLTDDEAAGGGVSDQDTEDENVLFLNKNATSPQRNSNRADMQPPVAPPRGSQSRLKPTKTVLATSLVTGNSTVSNKQAFKLAPLAGNDQNYGSTSPAVLPVNNSSRLHYDDNSEYMPRARLLNKNNHKSRATLPRESRRCRWFVQILWTISVTAAIITGLVFLLGPMYHNHELTLARLREMLGLRYGGCNLAYHAADSNHSLLETLPLMPFVQHIDATATGSSSSSDFVGVSLLAYSWHNHDVYTPVLVTQDSFKPLPYVTVEPSPDDGTSSAAVAAAHGVQHAGGAVITYQCLDDDVLSSRRACLLLTDTGWMVKLDAITGRKIWQHQLKPVRKAAAAAHAPQKCLPSHFNLWLKDDLDRDSFADYVLCIKITCDGGGNAAAASSYYMVGFMNANDGTEIGSFTPGSASVDASSTPHNKNKRQIPPFSTTSSYTVVSPISLYTQKNDIDYCAFVVTLTDNTRQQPQQFLVSIALQTLFLHYQQLTTGFLTPLVSLSSQFKQQPIQAIFNVKSPIVFMTTDNNSTTAASGTQNFLLVTDNYVGYANTTSGNLDWLTIHQNLSSNGDAPKNFQYADIITSMNVLAIQVCPQACSVDQFSSVQCNVVMIDITNGDILFQLATDCRRPSMNEREVVIVNVASQRQAALYTDGSANNDAAAAPISVPKKHYNRKDHGKNVKQHDSKKSDGSALKIPPVDPHKPHHKKPKHGVENKNDNVRHRRYIDDAVETNKFKRDYDFSNRMPSMPNRYPSRSSYDSDSRSDPHVRTDMVLDLNDEELAKELHGQQQQGDSSRYPPNQPLFSHPQIQTHYDDRLVQPPFSMDLRPPLSSAPARFHHGDSVDEDLHNSFLQPNNNNNRPMKLHNEAKKSDDDNRWPPWKPLVRSPPVKAPPAPPPAHAVPAVVAKPASVPAIPPPAAPLHPINSFLDQSHVRSNTNHRQNDEHPSSPPHPIPLPKPQPSLKKAPAAAAQVSDDSPSTSPQPSVTIVNPLSLGSNNQNSAKKLTVEDAFFTEIPPLIIKTTSTTEESSSDDTDQDATTLSPPDIALTVTLLTDDEITPKPSASLVQRAKTLFRRISTWFKSFFFKQPKEDDESLKTSRILSDPESNINTQVPLEVKFMPLDLLQQARVADNTATLDGKQENLSFRQRELINTAAHTSSAKPVDDPDADKAEFRNVFRSLANAMQSVDILFIKRHRNGTLSPYTITLTDELKIIDPEQTPMCSDLYNTSSTNDANAQIPRALCRNKRQTDDGQQIMPRHLYALIHRSRGMPVVLSRTNSFDSQVLIVSKVSLVELMPSSSSSEQQSPPASSRATAVKEVEPASGIVGMTAVILIATTVVVILLRKSASKNRACSHGLWKRLLRTNLCNNIVLGLIMRHFTKFLPLIIRFIADGCVMFFRFVMLMLWFVIFFFDIFVALLLLHRKKLLRKTCSQGFLGLGKNLA